MTIKNIAAGTVALIVGMVVISVVGTKIEQAMSAKLVYKNGELPPFAEIQDTSINLYQALVRLETEDGNFFCSGSVISDDYVLTAAHCLMSEGIIPGIRKDTINVVSMQRETDGIIRTVKAKAAALNTRADYALIKGDFKDFSKLRITVKPTGLAQVAALPVGANIVCGFPWGAEDTCYPIKSPLFTYFERFKAQGTMYPGMSGGPVIDLSTKSVFAVNTAVMDGGIVISPLVGLFETLGVRVIK